MDRVSELNPSDFGAVQYLQKPKVHWHWQHSIDESAIIVVVVVESTSLRLTTKPSQQPRHSQPPNQPEWMMQHPNNTATDRQTSLRPHSCQHTHTHSHIQNQSIGSHSNSLVVFFWCGHGINMTMSELGLG